MACIGTIKESFLSRVMLVMFFSFSMLLSHAVDTIDPKDMVRDNETLVSAGGVFELGFFGNGVLGNRFLGIWFKDDVNKKAVWVANRENTIIDSSGILQIRSDGNLIIIDRRQTPLIINYDKLATSGNTSATLLDSGNFILKEGENVIWESFEYPTDTYLPGMKLGLFGLNTDQSTRKFLVSWASPQNPSHGDLTLGVDYEGSTKLSVSEGDSVHMDVGFWDGQNFRFVFENSSNSYIFSYVSNENETYFTFSTKGSYVSTWFVMASTGQLNEYTISDGKISMAVHSLCNSSWCLPSLPSICKDDDKFSEFHGSMPISMFLSSSSDCGIMCRSNCSCTAFASQLVNQTGCQLYFGNKNDLLDIIKKGEGIIYIRGDPPTEHDVGRKRRVWLIILGPLASLMVSILVSVLCYFQWKNHKGAGNHIRNPDDQMNMSSEAVLIQLDSNKATIEQLRSPNKHELGRENDQELPLLSFSSIQTATNYFASTSKLGEGGFGPVYKGKLLQGQEIAVKRLSKRSGQGLEEFKNEITLISKLQHRNLVKLIGCCVEGEENILIYEYLPNKSLDSFIFDSTKRVLLDWRKRVNIIEGTAQGLLYLHKYSRLRIIHRDLKTSNILLDGDMNPKISDFGMARIFGENETRARTKRVVGTYGYMSPEYAMDGLFSEKSDVFSFGVIVLEIVSGKKNIAFFECDRSLNLLGNAWNLWKDGKSMELMDSALAASCSMSEVFRIVQLGLLCVQERAIDRPTMSDVVSMLSTDAIALLPPREPAFLSQLSTIDANSSSNRQRHYSTNDLTISEIYAR